MTELKMCPFCGEQIYYEVPKGSMDFDGHCWNKNCFMYGIKITFGDITKYNTRPIEDELESRIAQLTAENERLKQEVEKEAAWNDALSDNNELQFQYGEKLTAERDEWKAKTDRLDSLLHNVNDQLAIATDLGSKRWQALNDIYLNGEKITQIGASAKRRKD